MWQTVIETPTYSKLITKLLDEDIAEMLIEDIAKDPEKGNIIP